MRRLISAALLFGLCLAASNVAGKQTDARRRARELADSFSKSKHEIKEKRGVRVEKFKEVRSEPAMRQNAADYSGEYEADSQYPLSIRVAPGGLVEASGYEPAPSGARRFTLRGARLAGALLTATKVYDDGSTEKFEAVFINRTERNRPDDPGTTEFGLGVVYDPPKVEEGYTMGRLFYRLKQ
jgi:hypothetical protein